MKHNIPFLIASVGLFLSAGIVGFTFYQKDNGTVPGKNEYADDFKGAYKKEIEKNGNVKEVNLIAAEGNIEIFEGQKTRIWSYNHSVPAPEIRIQLGETLKINLDNRLPQETTIHFHGVRIPNSMDGVPGITQNPVKPGETFVYEFTPKDAGTFWFHPHVNSGEQVEKGLYGVLVVEDEYRKKYSQDRIWVIDDWRLKRDYQIDPNFGTPHDLMHDGRWGNVITVNGSLKENLSVRPGGRIRLRIVNTSNARVYGLNFGALQAKAIAVDGMYVKKIFDAEGFELSPGNRIDVDIKIPVNADGKIYPINDIFTQNTYTLGQLIVKGEAIKTPDFNYPTNEKIPDWIDAEKVSVDKEYVLNARRSASGGTGMMGGIEWTMNGKAFPEYDPFELRYSEFNKIRFSNESYRLHPMHLHGQFFKVLSRNGKPVSEDFFRDTVLVHPRETVEVGIVPLDKGKWVNHCHILEHADAGMMTVAVVQ